MYNVSSNESPKSYGDWYIVNEIDFMITDSSIRSELYRNLNSKTDIVDATYNDGFDDKEGSDDSDFDRMISERIEQINKETSDDVMKIKNKLDKIQSRWDQGNIKKYTQGNNSHPQLNKIDQLLGEAMKEVAEIQKGANIAVMELTKSVESVDELYSNTMDLKDSTGRFRRKAYEEKSSMPIPFKTQIIAAAISLIAMKFVISVLS